MQGCVPHLVEVILLGLRGAVGEAAGERVGGVGEKTEDVVAEAGGVGEDAAGYIAVEAGGVGQETRDVGGGAAGQVGLLHLTRDTMT